jgi:plastocyanin
MFRNGWLALMAIASLACSSGGDDISNPDQGPNGDVTVGNNVFTPANLNVDPGRTVTWVWNPGGVDHNIVFSDGSPGSGVKSSGSFQRTFSTAGSFAYFCSIHGASVMSGAVVVGGGSGGGGGGGGSGGGGGGYGSQSPGGH